jgi:hypothetical protein
MNHDQLFPSADAIRKALDGFAVNLDAILTRQQGTLLDGVKTSLREMWWAGAIAGLGWGMLFGAAAMLWVINRRKS